MTAPVLVGEINNGAATSIVAALTEGIPAGSTILLTRTSRSSTPHPTAFSVSDDAANSYDTDEGADVASNQLHFYRSSNNALLNSADEITINWTNSATASGLHVVKAAGLNLSDPLQSVAGNPIITGGASTGEIASIVDLPAGDWLLLGSVMQRNTNVSEDITMDANFTTLGGLYVGTHWHYTAYREITLGSPTTVNFQAVFGSSYFHRMGLAAYEKATPAGLILPGSLMMLGP